MFCSSMQLRLYVRMNHKWVIGHMYLLYLTNETALFPYTMVFYIIIVRSHFIVHLESQGRLSLSYESNLKLSFRRIYYTYKTFSSCCGFALHFQPMQKMKIDLCFLCKRMKCKLMDSANFEVDPFVVPKENVSFVINSG